MICFTGEALIDFIPVTDSSGAAAYRPAPGGSPYNSAIAAARLEVPTQFLGKVSTDFFGDQLIDRLETNHVDTDPVLRSAAPSTLAFVKKTAKGEARYAFFTNGAADTVLSPPDLPQFSDDVSAIGFGSISLLATPTGDTIVELVEAETASRVVSFDPNIRTVLIHDEPSYRRRVDRGVKASTIVKVSDEDLRWITGTSDLRSAAREILALGPRLVVVTTGEDGAFALTPRQAATVAAVPTTVEDTIGAGDSFHAAILAWLYHSRKLSFIEIDELSAADLTAMLRFAAVVASGTCGRPGADPPGLQELDSSAISWRR